MEHKRYENEERVFSEMLTLHSQSRGQAKGGGTEFKKG